MKMITLKLDNQEALTVYFADDAFIHIAPKPDAEKQVDIMKFIATALAKAGKKGNYYLQHAYFNPANQQQLIMIYAAESNLKQILQMKPHYDQELADANQVKPEDIKTSELKAKFAITRAAATKVVRGEHNPPIKLEPQTLPYQEEDSTRRKKKAASKLYLHKKKSTDEKAVDELKRKTLEDEAKRFAMIVVEPDNMFKPAIDKITDREEITEISGYVQKQKAAIASTEDPLIRAYLASINQQLDAELAAVITTSNEIILSNASQLEMHPERVTLIAKLNSYTPAVHHRSEFLSGLTAALYQAAKDYYCSIWKNDNYSVESLHAEIDNFNKIFGKFISINKDNLAISSIENALSKLSTNSLTVESIEQIISDMLNEAYARLGSSQRNEDRDAFAFIAKQLEIFDPDHKHFDSIVRQPLKHQFRLNEDIRGKMLTFDEAYAALLKTTLKQIDDIYTTGIELVDAADKITSEVTDDEQPQAKFTHLAALHRKYINAKDNIPKFKTFVETKNELAGQLENINSLFDNGALQLTYLDLPSAEEIGESRISLDATPEYRAIIRDIKSEYARLTENISKLKSDIQLQRGHLNEIISKAGESATSLTPISELKVARSYDAKDELNIDAALEATRSKLASLEKQFEQLVEQVSQSRHQYADQIAAIHLLAALHTKTKSVNKISAPRLLNNEDNSIEAIAELANAEYVRSKGDLRQHEEINGDEYAAVARALHQRPQLLNEIEQRRQTLTLAIQDANARLEAAKKDAYDILQCQLLVNALLNFSYWDKKGGAFGNQAQVIVNGQSYIVPTQIMDMIDKIHLSPNFSNNADAARAVIASLKDYAQQHPTGNRAVNGFYHTLQNTQPASAENHLTNIQQSPAAMSTAQKQQTSFAKITDLDALHMQTSTFWQRHPVLKKSLIGALIGSIIPVVGTLIGLFIGMGLGRRDVARARQQAQDPLLQPLLSNADNNPFADDVVVAAPPVVSKQSSNNPFDAPASPRQNRELGATISQANSNTLFAANSSQPKQVQPQQSASNNPFDAPPQEEVFDDAEDERRLKEEQRKLDEMVKEIEAFDETAFTDRLFAQLNPASPEKFAFENAFVINLRDKVIGLMKLKILDSKHQALEKSITDMCNDTWKAKEKNVDKRNANLKNFIDTLTQAYSQTCTSDFIRNVLSETAASQPMPDISAFDGSPLKDYELADIAQRRRFDLK